MKPEELSKNGLSLKGLPKEIIDYIKKLEQENEDFKEDSLIGWHNVLNKKLNQLKREVDTFDISLTKEDKSFERFWKAVVDSKEMVNNIDYLRVQSGMKKDAEKKSSLPIEDWAKNGKK